MLEVKRGYIFMANLPFLGGSIQDGIHPVVVVSNEKCNTHSPVISVVSFTSQEKPHIPTHIYVGKEGNGLTKDSTALCEQILTINKDCLIEFMGICHPSDLLRIEQGMKIQLGLVNKYVD